MCIYQVANGYSVKISHWLFEGERAVAPEALTIHNVAEN